MIHTQFDKYRFAAMMIFAFSCMEVMVDPCNGGQTGTNDSSMGVLNLEGTHLDYLVLRRRDGQTERITRPEATIELPVGEYRLEEVRLKGGYTWRSIGTSDWVTVAVGTPATLKVGAPLVPTIKVQRQGRILRLSYELRGVGGEAYTTGDRSKPPAFTVYKGQKRTASDKFEFG